MVAVQCSRLAGAQASPVGGKLPCAGGSFGQLPITAGIGLEFTVPAICNLPLKKRGPLETVPRRSVTSHAGAETPGSGAAAAAHALWPGFLF